jgi:hypothetical protein
MMVPKSLHLPPPATASLPSTFLSAPPSHLLRLPLLSDNRGTSTSNQSLRLQTCTNPPIHAGWSTWWASAPNWVQFLFRYQVESCTARFVPHSSCEWVRSNGSHHSQSCKHLDWDSSQTEIGKFGLVLLTDCRWAVGGRDSTNKVDFGDGETRQVRWRLWCAIEQGPPSPPW